MLRAREWLDRSRSSLFVLPAVAVVVAYFLARWLVGIDGASWVGESTVDSARIVLATVAGATITFASIAFSVALLVMQQGATQYSPRVLHGLMRDPFNRRVIAVVMATFTFCLVTLQRVRSPIGENGEALVPHLSTAVSVFLGLIAILSVIAAIHHTARNIDVSVILGRIVDGAEQAAPLAPTVTATPSLLTPSDHASWSAEHTPLAARRDGWVTSVDLDSLFANLAPGTTLRVQTAPGRYVLRGMRAAMVHPPLTGPDAERLEKALDDAVHVGSSRTNLQDPSFPMRQAIDVALRALSPAVNDPTTALDAMFHLGGLLVRWYSAPPAPNCFVDGEQRRIELPHVPNDEDVAHLAVTELRTFAGDNPAVYRYLLEMLDTVLEAIPGAAGRARLQPLRDQAASVVANAEAARLIPADRDAIRRAFEHRFVRHDHAAVPSPHP